MFKIEVDSSKLETPAAELFGFLRYEITEVVSDETVTSEDGKYRVVVAKFKPLNIERKFNLFISENDSIELRKLIIEKYRELRLQNILS
jgi:hypothetical protein